MKPPEKQAWITVIRQYRALDIAQFPEHVLVYRNTTQSIAASNTWANVTFTTALYPNGTYGVPIMWTTGTDVTILDDGFYMLTGNVGFASCAASVAERFRFIDANSNVYPGSQILVPTPYTYQFSGSHVGWFVRGTILRLSVSHAYTSALNLQGGVSGGSFGLARISG